jgi:hypothetical protein
MYNQGNGFFHRYPLTAETTATLQFFAQSLRLLDLAGLPVSHVKASFLCYWPEAECDRNAGCRESKDQVPAAAGSKTEEISVPGKSAMLQGHPIAGQVKSAPKFRA